VLTRGARLRAYLCLAGSIGCLISLFLKSCRLWLQHRSRDADCAPAEIRVRAYMASISPSFTYSRWCGFNFFHAGPAFESFPSGHMTSIFALVVVLWICYPRFWPTCVACMAAMGVALIAGNYHFLSDVIAGGFVGSSAAMLMVSIWEALDRRHVLRRVRRAASS
jgi:membrane-associated phospholipid phosphatase